MRIGFVGLGKLGLPVALAIEAKGHTVLGCDTSQGVRDILTSRRYPYQEQEVARLLETTQLRLCDYGDLVRDSDIIFVAVQTPHDPHFEGVSRLPFSDRKDFDYTYLKEAVFSVDRALRELKEDRLVVVISTVLPGTCQREFLPHLSQHFHLVYNPFFIAMGTVIHDFLNPEFVLLGNEDAGAVDRLTQFYRSIHDRPVIPMPIQDAELTKVAYNTWISAKLTITNTFMEICEKVGGNVDNVTLALKAATNRIVSPRYMDAGMGDGGSCHPRDNIALSWLAQELDLSYDIFSAIMLARERQTEWLADMLDGDDQIYIMGVAFKAETNITTGSAAMLLVNILQEKGNKPIVYDPVVGVGLDIEFKAGIYFIGTRHSEFTKFLFPLGSMVMDPWGYIPKQEGVEVVHIGRHSGK